MNVPDVSRALENVRAWYTDALGEYGIDSRAVGWPDAAKQALRFEKLAYVIDADSRRGPFTVSDWGCGYGAMFGFLSDRYGDRLQTYTGYDISPEMVEAASGHVTDPRARFVVAQDVLERADYAFASGTFNVHRGATREEWGAFIRERIVHMAGQSSRGIAFNLLTKYVDWEADDLFYGDPAEFFEFCRAAISPRVALLHDYPLYEWTMTVLHADAT